jgi:hypothetical protein
METTCQVNLTAFSKPGISHLDSIRSRAEMPLRIGIISAMPEITVEPSKIEGFWRIVLTVPVADRPFWIGFYEGMTFCILNRPMAIGVDG